MGIGARRLLAFPARFAPCDPGLLDRSEIDALRADRVIARGNAVEQTSMQSGENAQRAQRLVGTCVGGSSGEICLRGFFHVFEGAPRARVDLAPAQLLRLYGVGIELLERYVEAPVMRILAKVSDDLRKAHANADRIGKAARGVAQCAFRYELSRCKLGERAAAACTV